MVTLRIRVLIALGVSVISGALVAQAESAGAARGSAALANAGWTIGAGTYVERRDYRPPDAQIYLRRAEDGSWQFSDHDSPSDMMVEVLAVDFALQRIWLDADPETHASRDQRRSNAARNQGTGQRRYLCATPNRLFTSSTLEHRAREGYNVCTSVFKGDSAGLLGLEGVEIDRDKIAAAIERAGGLSAMLGLARGKTAKRQVADAAARAEIVRFQESLAPGIWTSCGIVTALSSDMAQLQRVDGSVVWLPVRQLTPRGHPVVNCTLAGP